jgi:hypothetical protein
VLHGNGLVSRDATGKSDPYCLLSIVCLTVYVRCGLDAYCRLVLNTRRAGTWQGLEQHKTRRCNQTTEPVWDETLTFTYNANAVPQVMQCHRPRLGVSLVRLFGLPCMYLRRSCNGGPPGLANQDRAEWAPMRNVCAEQGSREAKQFRMGGALGHNASLPGHETRMLTSPASPSNQVLRLVVWDWDLVGRHEFMGHVVLDLADMKRRVSNDAGVGSWRVFTVVSGSKRNATAVCRCLHSGRGCCVTHGGQHIQPGPVHMRVLVANNGIHRMRYGALAVVWFSVDRAWLPELQMWTRWTSSSCGAGKGPMISRATWH